MQDDAFKEANSEAKRMRLEARMVRDGAASITQQMPLGLLRSCALQNALRWRCQEATAERRHTKLEVRKARDYS